MALKDKYRIAYLDKDELVCLADVWATSRAEAVAQIENATQIIWVRLQVP